MKKEIDLSIKRQAISTMTLYDGHPRSKEELHRQAGEIVKRFIQDQPLTDMAIEILNLTSELKDVDPMFNKLFQFKYPLELNEYEGEEFLKNFLKWAVEEGLAPAGVEEEQLETEFMPLAIINGLATEVCNDYHLLTPAKIIKDSGVVYYLFVGTDSRRLVMKIDYFEDYELEALHPNAYGEVPLCMALLDDDKNLLDFIITTTKTLVPKQLPTPPSVIELAITEEPGNNCWTVHSDATGDFYRFHAKTLIQAALEDRHEVATPPSQPMASHIIPIRATTRRIIWR